MNNKVKIACATGAFIILVIVGYFMMHKNDDVVFCANNDEVVEKICVYVVGEIKSPGVFEVDYGMRIYEVIELAGGTTENADVSRINLAKILDDEEKVTIPKKVILEEFDVMTENGIVNINSASVEKLSNLNGIGKSTAEKIVKYRNENGYFNSIEDLMNVSGIGESKFNNIKDDIEV